MDDYLLPIHLELSSFAPPAQLVPTIYPSEEGVTERGASGRKGQGPHMLSTAVRIHLDPHKNVKVQPRLLLPTHLAWATACLVHGGLGSHRADCVPPPGVPGDPAAAQSHPTPLHNPPRTELALPGEPGWHGWAL